MMKAPATAIGINERKTFILVALVAFVYVVLRAILVPWVNDEALTFLLYVEPADHLPFKAPWDANNHFLNSWLMSLAYERIGLSHMGSRYGNVLAFLLYAWASYRIGGYVRNGFGRWCLWLALLFCPMLIELFGFARGYGMAVAFWLAATVWLMRLVDHVRLRDLVLTLVLLLLANAAVLVAVPVWTVVLGGILVLWMHQARGYQRGLGLLAWLVLGALPLAGAVKYSLELRERGGLFIGGQEGFVPVTVASLLKQLVGSDGILLAWVVTATMALAVMLLVVRRWRDRAMLVPAMLLAADVLSRVLMAWLMGVNYPNDRAVAHLVPWAIIALAFACDAAVGRARVTAMVFGVLLILPVRSLLGINVHTSKLYPDQSPPQGLVRAIVDEMRDSVGLLAGPRHMTMPLALEARRLGLEAPRMDGDVPERPWFELRVVKGSDEALLVEGYKEIYRTVTTGHALLRRDLRLTWRGELDTVTHERHGTDEYLDLLKGELHSHSTDRVIDISGPLSSGGDHVALYAVVSMRGSDGTEVYYEAYPLHLIRPGWNGEQLRLRLPVPSVSGAVGCSIYIWNIKKKPLRVGPFKVSLRRLEQ